jgi:hypothetical protein
MGETIGADMARLLRGPAPRSFRVARRRDRGTGHWCFDVWLMFEGQPGAGVLGYQVNLTAAGVAPPVQRLAAAEGWARTFAARHGFCAVFTSTPKGQDPRLRLLPGGAA